MIVSQENFKDRTDSEPERNFTTCEECHGTGVVTETEDGEDFYSIPCPICKGDGTVEDDSDEFSRADEMYD